MDETIKLYHIMMTIEGWSGQSEFTVPHLNPFMLRVRKLYFLLDNPLMPWPIIIQFTQVVICRCGFGLPIEWTPRKDGTTLAHFEEALSLATDTLHIRILTPNWLWALPFNLYAATPPLARNSESADLSCAVCARSTMHGVH